jgi:acyl-coenzyme A synthetase/AMP-(fatty) acid ligase
LKRHEHVSEAAVVGVPSATWGETPIGFVVLKSNSAIGENELLRWSNERLGKMQRLAAVHFVAALPRSPIGKVLKRELRDRYASAKPLDGRGGPRTP